MFSGRSSQQTTAHVLTRNITKSHETQTNIEQRIGNEHWPNRELCSTIFLFSVRFIKGYTYFRKARSCAKLS